MLIQALGGTLGLGTNFVVAGTLYSGLDLALGGTLGLGTDFRSDVRRARVLTQPPNYCLERDSDPNYLRSEAFRARVAKYH